jgi:group I intron endonuclease
VTRIGGVYAIRNVQNGKRYIGSSGNLDTRRRQHFAALRRGVSSSSILQNAFRKYGEQAFVFDVIEVCSDTELLRREQFYIDSLKPAYNVGKFANEKTRLGLKSSPEHVAMMSAALKGRASPMKGKKFTAEHRRKISEHHLAGNSGGRSGFKHTAEAKAKISAARKLSPSRPCSAAARLKRAETMRRWHASQTPEQKAQRASKMSEAQRGPLRRTQCAVCLSEIEYRSNGKRWIPKSCSSACLAEYRCRLLAAT